MRSSRCAIRSCTSLYLPVQCIARLGPIYRPATIVATVTDPSNAVVGTGQITLTDAAQTSNFGVVRLDHDFGQKWKFVSTYRYFKLKIATDDQVNIGGFFTGDKLGVPASQSSDPQTPWYYTAGFTPASALTLSMTFITVSCGTGGSGEGLAIHRKLVSWAALSSHLARINGNSQLFNVNTQQVRTKFLDGKDHYFRDDLSLLKGSHLFQFGGAYQHNFNWHQRTDNSGGINYQPVYQLGNKRPGISVGSFVHSGVSAADWGRDYAATLGIASIAQQAYTRTGSNLALNRKPLTPASDQSTIPYNLYFSDTWHMEPTFTLTYGLGWTLEMPPTEKDGKQIELVDSSNHLIDLAQYLHAREDAALQGQVYNPIVGSQIGRKLLAPFQPRGILPVPWSSAFG
jgi:hypothetical protein